MQTNENVLKKTNYFLAFAFLLLSLSIWATETPKNSIKGFFVANSETFFIQENTASNLLTNDLFGNNTIKSSLNSSNNKIELNQLNSETNNQNSKFNTVEFYLNSTTIASGLDYFYIEESNQTEKHFTANQFCNIQGSFFISSGTIFYVEYKKNEEFQNVVKKNHQFKKEIDETTFLIEDKQSKKITITKSLPFSGNSFWGFYSTKFATAPNIKNENKTLNYIFVVTHQKSFLEFNYQENNYLAIANQSAIQINFCKYCFSLPPPTVKI